MSRTTILSVCSIGTSLPSVSDALVAPAAGLSGGPAQVRIGTTGMPPAATAKRAPPRAEIQLSGRGSSLPALTRGKSINQRLIVRSAAQDAES